MTEQQRLYAQLNSSINQLLDACDSKVTPKLCAFRSTKGGREKLIKDIRERVEGGASIREAMMQIEREFNHNALD